eukprot:6740302-Lingulodinium_polyedra.AAC.1
MARLPSAAQWACSAVRLRSLAGEYRQGLGRQGPGRPRDMRPCVCCAVVAGAGRCDRAAVQQQPEGAHQRASGPKSS